MRILYIQHCTHDLWIVRLFEDCHKTSELHLCARVAHCTCIDHCAQYALQCEANAAAPVHPCVHMQWMYRRLDCPPDQPWATQFQHIVQKLQSHCDASLATQHLDCAICLEPLPPATDPVCNVHCSHWFHAACMHEWSAHTIHRTTCPCCRAPWATSTLPTPIPANRQCVMLT